MTSDSKWLGGGRLKTLFSVNFFNFQKSGRGGRAEAPPASPPPRTLQCSRKEINNSLQSVAKLHYCP